MARNAALPLSSVHSFALRPITGAEFEFGSLEVRALTSESMPSSMFSWAPALSGQYTPTLVVSFSHKASRDAAREPQRRDFREAREVGARDLAIEDLSGSYVRQQLNYSDYT
eukprot:CCRYP_003778-RA/>CCRYP_003778-RA protein AED:0.13 eAED:0.13 QI:0/0.5/0.33/1/0/0/3/338/111